MSKPKYKIGDIVRLLPWGYFNEHISISVQYWTELMDQDLEIYSIQKNDSSNLTLNEEGASGNYYTFTHKSFSWCEEFIKPTYTDYLTDKDFEI